MIVHLSEIQGSDQKDLTEAVKALKARQELAGLVGKWQAAPDSKKSELRQQIDAYVSQHSDIPGLAAIAAAAGAGDSDSGNLSKLAGMASTAVSAFSGAVSEYMSPQEKAYSALLGDKNFDIPLLNSDGSLGRTRVITADELRNAHARIKFHTLEDKQQEAIRKQMADLKHTILDEQAELKELHTALDNIAGYEATKKGNLENGKYKQYDDFKDAHAKVETLLKLHLDKELSGDARKTAIETAKKDLRDHLAEKIIEGVILTAGQLEGVTLASGSGGTTPPRASGKTAEAKDPKSTTAR